VTNQAEHSVEAEGGQDRARGSLHLEAIAGPEMDPVAVSGSTVHVFGRSSLCDAQLNHGSVSRRHFRITARENDWYIADLDSRHGTLVNGVQLDPGQPAPLGDGDLVGVGPWTFRIRIGEGTHSKLRTTNDYESSGHLVQRVPLHELRSVSERRFDLLVDCATAINSAETLEELAERVLDAVTEATRFSHAAFVRQISAKGEVEVVAWRSGRGTGHGEDPSTSMATQVKSRQEVPDSFVFSRSLIRACAEGELVRLLPGLPGGAGESIARLGITAAMCAPVMLGPTVEGYIYLDSRGASASAEADGAAFCRAISRIAGLALGNMKRAALEVAQERLAADLRGAREAQRMIMPEARGRIGRCGFALQTRPGRHVAGDLFDILSVSGPGRETDGRVGVLLGDVSGKGVGASILMTTTQAHLHASLARTGDPAETASEVNQYLTGRVRRGSFVSLWMGVIDPASETLRFVDAGHGYWFVIDPGGSVRRVACKGGYPLCVEHDRAYHTEETVFPVGSRVVLFSDGLPEQTSPEGEQLGIPRVAEVLGQTGSSLEDVKALGDALRSHTESDHVADDLTIASVTLLPAGD